MTATSPSSRRRSLSSRTSPRAATGGFRPRRLAESAHPSIVPFQAFGTADGWIVVACAKQIFWERLCHALERPELLADPRFSDFAGRDKHREELLAILRPVFQDCGSQPWIAKLSEAGVPVGPVNEVADALEDEQAHARHAVVEVDHPRFGRVRQVATPLRLSGHTAPLRRAPLRGEHTQTVLAEVCGYDSARIEALASAGAFGAVRKAGGRHE